jgi:hypothetical protein
MARLTIPLHLAQDDHSTAADSKRFDLMQAMQMLRPQGMGFRMTPTSKKGAKAIAKKNSNLPTTRMERIGLRMIGAKTL